MWIRSVAPRDAEGLAREVYEAAIRRAGRVFQIVRAMSLAPAVMQAALELYRRVMFDPSALSRRQREMIAVVVSRTNHCHY